MLFNSIEFIFIFLPIMVCLFYFFQNKNMLSLSFLLIGSLIFYAYHDVVNLILICSSILFNFYTGRHIYKNKFLLSISITINIIILGYVKYYFFLISNVNYFFSKDIYCEKIVLPLGISFFTFQQIAYLVDTYRLGSPEQKIVPYALLVSFFPHSIAGPLVQYKEIIPQFKTTKISAENIVIGGSIFIVGLFKKMILADGLAPCANIVFDAASNGTTLTFIEAWMGAICYTLQIYFDFSGYSDMAIGLAKIFNIQFPINFNSPYKSTSIIEFWHSWHITLSNFLKNYLYIPLGGNQYGSFKKYRNLLITMTIGGLWHGANWTFIIWGGLHGLFLIINHLWRNFCKKHGINFQNRKIYTMFFWFLTMNCIICAWVFFRASDLHVANSIIKSMSGFNGIPLPPILLDSSSFQWINYTEIFNSNIFNMPDYDTLIITAITVCFVFPNVRQHFDNYHKNFNFNAFKKKTAVLTFYWNPSKFHAFVSAIMTSYILFKLFFATKMDFLYFDF